MQLQKNNDHVGGHHVLLSARDLLRKEAKEKAKQEAKDARVPCGDPPLIFLLPYLEDHPRTDISGS